MAAQSTQTSAGDPNWSSPLVELTVSKPYSDLFRKENPLIKIGDRKDLVDGVRKPGNKSIKFYVGEKIVTINCYGDPEKEGSSPSLIVKYEGGSRAEESIVMLLAIKELLPEILDWWNKFTPKETIFPLKISFLNGNLGTELELKNPEDFLREIECALVERSIQYQSQQDGTGGEVTFYATKGIELSVTIDQEGRKTFTFEKKSYPPITVINPITNEILCERAPELFRIRSPNQIVISYNYDPTDVPISVELVLEIANFYEQANTIRSPGALFGYEVKRRRFEEALAAIDSPEPEKLDTIKAPEPHGEISPSDTIIKNNRSKDQKSQTAKIAATIVESMRSDGRFLLDPNIQINFRDNKLISTDPRLSPQQVIDSRDGSVLRGFKAYPYPVLSSEGKLEIHYSLDPLVGIRKERITNAKLREIKNIFYDTANPRSPRIRSLEEVRRLIAEKSEREAPEVMENGYKLPKFTNGRTAMDAKNWQGELLCFPGTTIPVEGGDFYPYPIIRDGKIYIRYSSDDQIEGLKDRASNAEILKLRSQPEVILDSDEDSGEVRDDDRLSEKSDSPLEIVEFDDVALELPVFSEIEPYDPHVEHREPEIPNNNEITIDVPLSEPTLPEEVILELADIDEVDDPDPVRVLDLIHGTVPQSSSVPVVVEKSSYIPWKFGTTLGLSDILFEKLYSDKLVNQESTQILFLLCSEDPKEISQQYMRSFLFGFDKGTSGIAQRGLVESFEYLVNDAKNVEIVLTESKKLSNLKNEFESNSNNPEFHVSVCLTLIALDFIKDNNFPEIYRRQAVANRKSIKQLVDQFWIRSELKEYDDALLVWGGVARSIASNKMRELSKTF